MAEADLVLDADWDISKAQAKARKLQREFDEAKREAGLISDKIKDLNSALDDEKQKQTAIKLEIRDQLAEMEKLERAVEKIKSGKAAPEDFANIGSLEQAEAQLEEMQIAIEKNNQAYEKSYQNSEKLTREIHKQEYSYDKQRNKVASIGDEILLNGKKTNRFAEAFKKSEKSADRFGKRLKSLIASALFFSVVTKAFTALREEFGKLINETGTRTASLIARINGNLAVIGRTLYETAKPAIEFILSALVKMTNILANGLAKILGKNVNEMKKLAQATKKQGDEAKKSTAGFDTLQTLGSSEGANQGSIGTDFSALNSSIDSEIGVLMLALSGAALVLGVILAFTGVNIPLGLGLIAIGAVGMAATFAASWDTMSQKTKDTITGIMSIGGVLFLLLGLILILTGVGIPLGIGLIFLGAGLLYGAIKLSPGDDFLEKIKNLWVNAKSIIKEFIVWFRKNVTDGIFGAEFGQTLSNMFDSWCYLWEDIVDFFKAVAAGDWKKAGKAFVNVFIDLLNLFIAQLVLPFQLLIGGISKLTGLVGKLFDKDWEFDTSWTKVPKIPRLATGAILPGGSPMLAWVNDQPKGQPYLEGSIDNIAAAFEKYLGGRDLGNKTFKVEAKGNMAQLIRLLALEITEEQNRVSVF